VAEQEREAISIRTKAALAAARARGVKLGTPKPERSRFHDRAAASTAGSKSGEIRAALANEFAKLIRPLLDGELAGLSANAAAAELNRRGVQTARGNGRWSAQAVLNLKRGRADMAYGPARAEALRPVFDELKGKSARAIAAELDARKILTPTGKSWHAETVLRVQRRLED
jgi:DNA invertase Pin-like site-specific DNA recombinase